MKIEKTECNYQVTECDLKFGEQITLDDDLLIPASVLDKIKSEIDSLGWCRGGEDYFVNRKAVDCILDKYKARK